MGEKSKMAKANIRRMIVAILAVFILVTPNLKVVAAGENALLQVQAVDEDVVAFVRGIDVETSEVEVQIGTSVCGDVVATAVLDENPSIKTLIMLDNSKSIPEKDKAKISEVLQNIISDRAKGELVAFAYFHEDVQFVTDFTDDYPTLKEAIDNIKYEDQETYLTDVLAKYLNDNFVGKEVDTFNRIIIISDGVDNKENGLTSEELIRILEKNPIPIYTIGCSTGKNNDQLEKMFSLSRATSGESFIISSMESLMDVNSVLKLDWNVAKLVISPKSELLDGTQKALKITANGVSVESEVKMPMVISQPSQTPTEKVTDTPTPTPTTDTDGGDDSDSDSEFPIVLVLSIALAVILLIVIVVVIIVVLKKNKENSGFTKYDPNDVSNIRGGSGFEAGETEMIGGGEGATMLLDPDSPVTGGIGGGFNPVNWNIVLTDMDSPTKKFSYPLSDSGSIVIGRSREQSDLVIDYDGAMSRRHCKISVNSRKFYIEPLNDSNGTFVNGSRILAKEEIISGNEIKMGRSRFKFEVK